MSGWKRLSAAVFFILSAAAWAQTDAGGSGDDPYDTGQFDEAVEKSVKEDEAAKVEVLFGGTFLLQDYISSYGTFTDWTSELKLLGKPFLKVTDPRLGSVFLSYSIASTLYQASNNPPPTLVPTDPFVPVFALSEFFVSFDFGKAVFLRAGNQINSWGPSFFWTPVDFVNRERANALSALDVRAGVPSLKVHVPFSRANLFLFVDFRDTVSAADGVGAFFRTVNTALRFDLTLGGIEFGLTGYLDAASGRLVNKYGLDASGNFLGFDLYTEQAVSLRYEHEENPQAFFESYQACAGFSRTLDELKEWTLQAEFFYNSAGTDERAATLPPGAFVPFYTGRYYLFASLYRANADDVLSRVEAQVIVNFSDLSFLARLSAVFSFARTLPVTVSVSYADGDNGDEFAYAGPHQFTATVSANFVF
ncbi:MAG: hypothetical protein JXD23_14725 [Spirochaetales bacterium]|nr:hypothetical protein [Spirochaetales bacterium]